MNNKIVTLENLQVNNEQIKQWVEGIVAGKVDYLGVINSPIALSDSLHLQSLQDCLSPGDYFRASENFTLTHSNGQTEDVHAGDLIVCKQVTSTPELDYWDVIHTEDPGNYVTLNTAQTITGEKTFENKIQIKSAAGEPERHTYLGLESLTFTSFNMDSFDSYITFWDNVKDREYNLKLPDLPDSVRPGNDLTEVIATQEWAQANFSNNSTIDQEFFNSLYK
jgi:hypothetical protein